MAVVNEEYNRYGRTPDAQLPAFTGEQIRAKLRQYDRAPFIDLLADWMGAAPSAAEIRKWAAEKPHLFANALSTLGRLAGFAENKNINISGSIDLSSMSDSQIEDRMKELLALGVLPKDKIIDGAAETVPSLDRSVREQAEEEQEPSTTGDDTNGQ